jgi:hypothetical protein
MNYFAHGRKFLDDPYFLAGTAVPDWMNVADRRVRVRSKHALALVDDADPVVARLAAGMLQHFHDDAWFHNTLAFAELSLTLSGLVRDVLAADDGFRPSFLGHILVEILLDAILIAEDPAGIVAYYAVLDGLDGPLVERAVNRMAPRPTDRLAALVGMFSRERFLLDYSDDAKLLFRLNQVMRRVQLPTLPPALQEIFPAARGLVAERRAELLTPTNCEPTSETQPCRSA